MGDWMVVMSETLFVKMKIRTQTERHMQMPRMVESCSLSCLSVRESGGMSRGSDVCLSSAAKVLGDADRRGAVSDCASLDVISNLQCIRTP